MPARLMISQQKYRDFTTKIVNSVLASSHKDVDKYLNEHAGMIDTASVGELTSKLRRKASHKLGAKAIEKNFFSDRRILLPRDDGFYRSPYVEIDLRDIPKQYLDIDALVPDFQNLVENIIEERKSKKAREQRIKDIFARVADIDPYVRNLEDVLIFSYDRLYIRDRLDPRGPIEIGVKNKDADYDDPSLWCTEFGVYSPKLDMDDEAINQFVDVLYDFYDDL